MIALTILVEPYCMAKWSKFGYVESVLLGSFNVSISVMRLMSLTMLSSSACAAAERAGCVEVVSGVLALATAQLEAFSVSRRLPNS